MDVKLCKIVLKYTRATVTVHIYTVTIALPYIILIISNFAPFFSLSSPSTKQRPHYLLLPLIHTLPQTKSKINHKNKKSTITSTTKSTPDTIKPNTPTHEHTNGDRESGSACLDRSFRSACLDRCVWIGVLLAVLGSEFQIDVVLGSECSCVNNFFNSFRSALVVVDWLNP